MVELHLHIRIQELEEALATCRRAAVDNLHNPGNENDTLEFIESTVNGVLHDTYEYAEEDEDGY